ncbi:MAG: phosphorylcholine transferase LicD [Breznakia sp.]
MENYILKTKTDGSVITVRALQLVLLEMLKDFDKLCKKHNIPYFLTGGSCLGAVRHNGFIPWDDDCDVGMLYQDYLRFLEVAKKELDSNKYYIQCFDTHKEYNVFIPAMKFRKRGTYCEEVNFLLKNRCTDGDGVFLDVFIVDYISENKLNDVVHRLWCYPYLGVITLLENIGIKPTRLKKHFLQYARNYSKKNQHSSLVGYDLSWVFSSPFHPVVCKKEDLFPVQYHTFEDTLLPIPRRPKVLLDVEISPNHMKYPPLHMQQPKHMKDIDL